MKEISRNPSPEPNSALSDLAAFWRLQAGLWAEQEKAWHAVALFCRQIRTNKRKDVSALRRSS